MSRLATAITLAMLMIVVGGCSSTLERIERQRYPKDEPGASARPVDPADLEVAPLLQPKPVPNEVAQDGLGDGELSLATLIESVETHFPELLAARQEIERTEGMLVEARGGFDPVLKGKGKFTRGFYDTEELDVEVRQPTPFLGTTFYSGYRIGSGNFPTYYGGRETNRGGEFRVGAELPILRNREIDSRRAELWRARLERDAADPQIQEKRVGIARKASKAYWYWVATGKKVEIVEGLLELASARQKKLEVAVEAGELEGIILVENERLVVERQRYLVAARRDFEAATLVLSLYLRDAAGEPIRPGRDALPKSFPERPRIELEDLDAHILYGLAHRPELALLGYARAQSAIDVEFGENLMLPRFDLEVFASQDVGGSISPKEPFDPAAYGFGISVEVPLLRRKARGKLRSARAKLAKIGQDIRLQADRIEIDIRDAASAFHRAYERVELALRDLELAQQMEEAERILLNEGASDLIRINIREQATARARAAFVELEAACFIALADYGAALGLPHPPADDLAVDEDDQAGMRP